MGYGRTRRWYRGGGRRGYRKIRVRDHDYGAQEGKQRIQDEEAESESESHSENERTENTGKEEQAQEVEVRNNNTGDTDNEGTQELEKRDTWLGVGSKAWERVRRGYSST